MSIFLREGECYHLHCFYQNRILNRLLWNSQWPKAATGFDDAFQSREQFPVNNNCQVFSEVYNGERPFCSLALLLNERRICSVLGFFLNNASAYPQFSAEHFLRLPNIFFPFPFLKTFCLNVPKLLRFLQTLQFHW